MRITIVGAGYVGLVNGVGFAQLGHQVTLVDTDCEKVEMINRGEAPMYEQGLEALLLNLVAGNLKATSEIEESIYNADIIFLCVQSSTPDNEATDLTYIKKAAKDVGTALIKRDGYPIIVSKSTIASGSTEETVIPLLEQNSGKKVGVDFAVMVNPEFLREGTAIADFLKPDRIVIGGSDKRGLAVLSELYKDFDAPVIKVDLKTAEMIKCASNAFLATKISFINEIGNICKRLGIDVYQVAEGMGADPRISPYFLKAGIGFGGSCLPKDTKGLATMARNLGYQPVLLESVLQINEEQPLRLVELADKKLRGLLGKKVAIMGLAFKPGTDDMRKSPTVRVIEELRRRGATIEVYDPVAEGRAKKILGDIVSYAPSAVEAISKAELVFILTEWDEFRNPDLYKGKVVFDGRRVLELGETKSTDYEGICW